MLDYIGVQNRVHTLLTSPWAFLTGEKPWPGEVFLHPAHRSFGTDRARLDEWTDAWRAREQEGLPDGVFVRWEADGPDRRRPRALRFADVAAAARFVGSDCVARVERGRAVVDALRAAGAAPTGAAVGDVVRQVDQGRVTLDELVRGVGWALAVDDLSVLSPRTIGRDAPLGSKWLTDHAPLLAAVCGFDVVASMRARPRTVLFTYVDDAYLARGARRHDSWTEGDPLELPYVPSVVLVVENAHPRFDFPAFDGGIVVYGGGDAAPSFVARIPWPEPGPVVAYWGDLDRDGFEILDAMRRALDDDVPSILMDRAAYERYADRGVNVDRHGRPLAARSRPRPLAGLSDAERAADALVCADGHVRRIEQEVIPPEEAALALRRVVGGAGRSVGSTPVSGASIGT